MPTLTDGEVKFLAGLIPKKLQEGITRQAILDDIASVCGREWAEQFLSEVEKEAQDYPGPPKGRVELRIRGRARLKRAIIPTLLGLLVVLGGYFVTGDIRAIVFSVGALELLYGVFQVVTALRMLKS